MTTGGKTTPHAAWLIVVVPIALVIVGAAIAIGGLIRG